MVEFTASQRQKVSGLHGTSVAGPSNYGDASNSYVSCSYHLLDHSERSFEQNRPMATPSYSDIRSISVGELTLI